MLDVDLLREQFAALNQVIDGRTPIFLDGPGGTQVPQRVVDAMVRYLTTCNANHGGAFATSRTSDAILHEAHAGMADFLNAPSADEIVFGANMTTLALHLSRALAQVLKPGDEVMVSRLDHDANVSPWVHAAKASGAIVRWIDFHPEDGTLNLEDARKLLGPRTRWVAVGLASNAVGTINEAATIARWAKEVGAWVFMDAVHFAPHGPIDVQALGCDFLACSGYKFFGPHVGILWGKRMLLEDWPACKLRPVPERLPDRWMTGTQNHEGLAGLVATLDYLAEIGAGNLNHVDSFPGMSGRRRDLHVAMAVIQAHEQELSRRLLEGLHARPRFKVLGLADPAQVRERVPTVSLTCADYTPLQLAEHLAERQIFAWNGNMYALELSERLGLEPQGFLRLGLVHYNSFHEIDLTLEALDAIE